MAFGVIDRGFENVQHIVTETATEYYARKQMEADEVARVKWFNMKLTIAGMLAFFVMLGVMFVTEA